MLRATTLCRLYKAVKRWEVWLGLLDLAGSGGVFKFYFGMCDLAFTFCFGMAAISYNLEYWRSK